MLKWILHERKVRGAFGKNVPPFGLKGRVQQKWVALSKPFVSFLHLAVCKKISKNCFHLSQSISGKKNYIQGAVTPHPLNSYSTSVEQQLLIQRTVTIYTSDGYFCVSTNQSAEKSNFDCWCQKFSHSQTKHFFLNVHYKRPCMWRFLDEILFWLHPPFNLGKIINCLKLISKITYFLFNWSI